MGLTIKQLALNVEEGLTNMALRLVKAEREYDGLNDRIDRSLINNENFRKETQVEFSFMREEFDGMRAEFSNMRAEFAFMREEFAFMRNTMAQLQATMAQIQSDLAATMHATNSAFTADGQRFLRIEKHLGLKPFEN